jgi:[ribosomal protein S5]-alanine N-acetyltransferase
VRDDVRPIPLPDPPLSERTLLLRPWAGRDIAAVQAAGRDALISRYRYSLPRTLDEARAWLAATERERERGTRLELAITEAGIPLGSISLTDLVHANAMVRYWLLPAGRGRGLATTAVRLLCDWAFSTLNIGRVGALFEVDNHPSRAVVERCSFVREGLLRQHMTARDGKRVDTLIYGLLPDDVAPARGPVDPAAPDASGRGVSLP